MYTWFNRKLVQIDQNFSNEFNKTQTKVNDKIRTLNTTFTF